MAVKSMHRLRKITRAEITFPRDKCLFFMEKRQRQYEVALKVHILLMLLEKLTD